MIESNPGNNPKKQLCFKLHPAASSLEDAAVKVKIAVMAVGGIITGGFQTTQLPRRSGTAREVEMLSAVQLVSGIEISLGPLMTDEDAQRLHCPVHPKKKAQ